MDINIGESRRRHTSTINVTAGIQHVSSLSTIQITVYYYTRPSELINT